jgi:tape measure domain-containing protein
MKTLEYLIKANSSDFVTAVTKAETIYGQALKGMADKAKQISLFKQAKDDADSTGTALVKLKATAEQVRKALGDGGGSLQQSQQLAKAEAAISKTEAAMRGQVAAVVSMRQALAAAGVDTRNLAIEQDKMATAIAKASASVIQNRRTNAARDVLGIRSELDATREIKLVQAAYDRLAATGTVSHNELDRAAAATKARIAALRQELRGGAEEVKLFAAPSASVNQVRRTGAARDVLGIRSEVDITREINQVQAAYDRLAATGTVSHNELDRAAAATKARIAALRQELRGGAEEVKLFAAPSVSVNQVRRTGAARDVLGIRSQTDIQREIQQVSAAFSRLTQNPAISMAELSRAATATKARIAELRAELQGTMPASSFLMTGAGKLVAMASAVVSLNAALALTRSILSTAGQFETLRTQLNAVEKSATKGGEAFAYIKQQAINTPFQVTNLTQTYIRLRNYGLDPTAGSMQAIIDQAAKLGGSQEMLERITLALGQAWTKQKLQGEEIMQLNEAGVPVWDLLSKAMNKSAAELMKLSENGQLGRDAITALMQAMENDAAGVAASQMQTWNGIVSNATDLWNDFLDSIGQAGLLQFAKDSITQLTTALQKMKETGELSQIAHDIADALQALGKIAIGTAKFITAHHDAIIAVAAVYGALAAKKLFAGLATDLVTFATAATKAGAALRTLKEAQTVGDIIDTVVGKGVRKATTVVKAAQPVSTLTKVATGVMEGATYAQGVTETYRLAKAVPAAAGAGVAVEGAKAAEAAAIQSGAAWSAAANVAKKAWMGMTSEVALTSSVSLTGVAALIARFTVFGTVAYASYKALEPIISNTIDLYKMEVDALEQKRQTLEEINRLEREGAKQDGGTGTGSVTRIMTASELASSSSAQLKSYRENLDRAHKIQFDQAVQRARNVTRTGGDSDKDPEYQKYLADAITYKKALKALDDYEAQRLKLETGYSNQIKAIKNGQLETLAVSLAKEQKLYDKANEQLQAAVAARQKHQDAWANNKAVDPATKATEPQGVTDYYDSLQKAQALARAAQDSQKTANTTGLDGDFQKATRDAAAAETAFGRVMDVINQLRSGGKITEGEFKLFNDQAGRAQDSLDAGAEKTAKSSLQAAMEKMEALKAAAAAIQKLDISVSFNDKQAVQDMESMINRIQQAAQAHPVKIATALVGPDGKLLQDARQAIGLPDRPTSELTPGPSTAGSSDKKAAAATIPAEVDKKTATADLNQFLDSAQLVAKANPIKVPVNYIGGSDAATNLAAARRQVGLPDIQSHADGGAISGPGTGTSDSILSRLSNGEFVVRAAATSYYGPDLLHAINQMRLPRFATGGVVGQLPAVSRAMSAMPSLQASTSSAAIGQSSSPLNIWLPGAADPITVQAPDSSVKQLRDAALKHNLKFGK